MQRIFQISALAHSCAVALAMTLASVAAAQQEAQADDVSDREAERESGAASTPPSLDELLGLPGDGTGAADRNAEEAARRAAEEELQRRLEQGRQTANAFAEAIEKMLVSANLLDEEFDTGIGTQRIQEDIIAQLTHLIDSADTIPSPTPSPGQQQDRDQQQRPDRQEQSQQQAQSEQQQREGEPQEGMPPPLQEGDVHTSIEETRAEWGALPERIREMLIQGMDEKFSSMYEQLTREYYRSLAAD